MTLQDFVNNEFINYPVYDNIRKISSYLDGLKNTSRKVLFTTLEKNINKETQCARLSATVSEYSNYIHGQVSIEGVIVNMAQNFSGSNNLPWLVPEGHFGDRLSPEAAASRYIYTKNQPYLRDIYKKEDEYVLKEQYFEGQRIEYKHYIPIIPMLLVNGSEGLSTGFAQKILPRNINDIIEYIKGNKNELKPYYKDFNGIIQKYENGWEIVGIIKKEKKNTLTIEEIPIGYNLSSYIKVLDKLEDTKKIKSYKDLSQNDKFKFEIKVDNNIYNKDEDYLLDLFKLRKKVSENFTSIDENNKIIEFKNAYELIDKYMEKRLEFYSKRKLFLLDKLLQEIEYLKDKMNFITKVINNKIVIYKKSKDDIIKSCISNDIKNYEDFLRMNILSLTQDKIDELSKEINKKQNEHNELKNKTEKDLWDEELNILIDKLNIERKSNLNPKNKEMEIDTKLENLF